jgi:hypothetical protein
MPWALPDEDLALIAMALDVLEAGGEISEAQRIEILAHMALSQSHED